MESGLIAEGSINGLLSGSHFNRCKKIHQITALSFKTLHFKEFLKEYNESDHIGKIDVNEIEEILKNESSEREENNVSLLMLKDVIDHYDLYTQKTINGDHGCTPKFILLYVWFVELYQLFERAIRTSDLNMYIFAAYYMCSLFFTFNHQNYARWLTRNLDDLMNIEKTHPGLLIEFQNGALSIRRTANNFCRSAIDLTLEQTINANLANRLTGISAFTNSLHARQRWCETHTIRMAITTQFLEFLDIFRSSESSDNEYKNKIFNRQLKQFTEEVCKNINPFSSEINRFKLFNLSSGKAATEDISEFLLNVECNGLKQMRTFIEECQNDISRFNRPIKRNAIRNFSVEIYKTKNATGKPINETKTERNILGHVLCLALENKIDLSKILSHPLTTVPHSLAHCDGYMISNHQKGEITTLLMSQLKIQQCQQSEKLPNFDVDIFDGFNLLRSFQESPIKYGLFATFVLRRICNTSAHEIHIIFDKYDSPSPRDIDMIRRKNIYGYFTNSFEIKGPNQERNVSLAKCLANTSFKEELIKFIIDYWSKDEVIASVLGNKRVFLSFGSKCYLFSNSFEKGKILSSFQNNHMEVESKMILHIHKIRAMNIRVCVENADPILIYSLYHMQFWLNEKEIWIETGDVSKNTFQLVNVHQIFSMLSPSFINALPAWYIFSGCAYEPSFYGKGRKTCFKILQKKSEFEAAFGFLGNNSDMPNEEHIAVLEEYTCELYNNKSKNVNRARLDIFQNAYGSKERFDFKRKGIISF